ncbi:lysylphosphatidylglycerol synthase transmembrane domain-containing protein [Methanocorpusculum vombati]|uniref:Flippase-like domain-containing protein n=1 Tax=Methanocorpusculum vombati TaxID=3002864 RepID=A0ABT4INW6_9EURY|nr:flippase-like domain-containing protein [Methanocorpusculum vombati]MCZ9320452.1 flippase-like domain-containing protein [Methanocorpusculum sp.]MCZ0863454.1 flippase-like domain-containing protein [Methanocorpusculum vombati]MDE2519911.1 flippase-like domain-containing protein [Methanocorpusculum sp.]MDE2533861.1 flippase-like domain-containing protein [Methanocorpusculum sp.]MDE2546085.1 flippase-like domain-containing protein [Methanocorpusculum sp.]
MNKAQKKWLFISVGISVVALVVMLLLTFDTDTLVALEKCNPWYILLGFLLHILSIVFWALRIKLMCWSLGYRVPFFHSVNLICANMLVAAVTPSQVGGEAVRVYELYKSDVPTADATAVVLMERVFDGIVLGIGTVVGVYLLGKMFSHLNFPPVYMGVAYFATFFFIGALLLFAVLVKRPQWTKIIVAKVSGLFTRRWDSQRIDRLLGMLDENIDRFYVTIGHFGGRSKIGMALGLLMTVAFWASEFIIASVLMVGLGLEPMFLISFIFQLLIAMIMMIPLTPGGVGVAEVSIAAFYSIIIPLPLVGVFVLLWRLILYYFNVVVGLIASLRIVRREARDSLKKTQK